ncbi:hypothetical protein BAUCODRAFT_269184 [Baudoinia panamericana UAMH 10762]|uniref:Uncharacterized protein n=1 Tax=Baudoinia panamericana (strain UAMH 10762) TaxID=717646 RepID=M2N2U9_BAUPA|nr:uncharacterized protein BAUCODRAFT_269184 [Baudoinia panamericana UAMH 10762]EMC92985.1 hypothetical protein BAUCODRAFT_269184 [Baudoinia panamericana UAMH 10762]
MCATSSGRCSSRGEASAQMEVTTCRFRLRRWRYIMITLTKFPFRAHTHISLRTHWFLACKMADAGQSMTAERSMHPSHAVQAVPSIRLSRAVQTELPAGHKPVKCEAHGAESVAGTPDTHAMQQHDLTLIPNQGEQKLKTSVSQLDVSNTSVPNRLQPVQDGVTDFKTAYLSLKDDLMSTASEVVACHALTQDLTKKLLQAESRIDELQSGLEAANEKAAITEMQQMTLRTDHEAFRRSIAAKLKSDRGFSRKSIGKINGTIKHIQHGMNPTGTANKIGSAPPAWAPAAMFGKEEIRPEHEKKVENLWVPLPPGTAYASVPADKCVGTQTSTSTVGVNPFCNLPQLSPAPYGPPASLAQPLSANNHRKRELSPPVARSLSTEERPSKKKRTRGRRRGRKGPE